MRTGTGTTVRRSAGTATVGGGSRWHGPAQRHCVGAGRDGLQTTAGLVGDDGGRNPLDGHQHEEDDRGHQELERDPDRELRAAEQRERTGSGREALSHLHGREEGGLPGGEDQQAPAEGVALVGP